MDSLLVVVLIILAFSIRLGEWFWPDSGLLWITLGAPLIAIPVFLFFGIYKTIIRYIGFKSLWVIIKAISLYALIWGVLGFMSAVEGIPRSVIIINWILVIIVLSGTRLIAKWIFGKRQEDQSENIMIYGAGSTGRNLANFLSQSIEYNLISFVDDDKKFKRKSIDGLDVISTEKLKTYILKHHVSEIILAMPSLTRTRRKEIVKLLSTLSVRVRSVPSLKDFTEGKLKIADLHEIDVEDLLGREAAIANKKLLKLNISGKTVMITGAGGSIGSELCRQALSLKPKILILYELNEYALYSAEKELSSVNFSNIRIIPILGSVQNKNRLLEILNCFKVQTIYHAAAYKHVPLVEFNNTEGIINNIFGTLICAQIAIYSQVETFVLISTDKAVRPTNTMGASKRFAEMILQALSSNQNIKEITKGLDVAKVLSLENITKFSIVRFGNVLNSSGSVIPLFKEQIKSGGPITVTDSKVIRYFMTIPEAVELVIQAGAMGLNGDVFVLDMGEPVKILDLAKKMITLSGLEEKNKRNPYGDIEIEFTGLRPGEKLYEELIIGDNVSPTTNPMILRAKESSLEWSKLELILDEMEKAIKSYDIIELRKLLITAVPEFKPNTEVVDLLYTEISNKRA
jgi:FlaA1/EpsC-like NDP-sugar epimerase